MSAGTQRFSGRLAAAWSVTEPAAPGWAQHARHQEDAPGADTDRDEMPSGGGWQPPVWDTVPGVQVMTGHSFTDATGTHHGGDSHDGHEGRGAGTPRSVLANTDKPLGGPSGTSPMLGAAGAANGGLRAEGSAPWMSPAITRRRADGGVVTRAGGFRLGELYVRLTGIHRQGLHMNRPTIRGVREAQPTKGNGDPLRRSGVLAPTPRTPIAPVTSGVVATARTGPAAPSVIGSGWVQ